MKQNKKTSTKLALSTQTIRTLRASELNAVAGGVLSGTYCASTVTLQPTSTALTCSCA
jgi:hypothetical protein